MISILQFLTDEKGRKVTVQIDVTTTRSYGFRTFRVTKLALYHSLGKLPEPTLTHRFY